MLYQCVTLLSGVARGDEGAATLPEISGKTKNAFGVP